jgi:diaminopimelate epimerase
MVKIPFYKYQATGNDFVIIDHFKSRYFDSISTDQVAHICDRRFGIGADGMMIIEPDETFDFKMVYYNSDGRLSTMCGNGGRAISHLAFNLGYIKSKASFIAVDGPHQVIIGADQVELKMNDVIQINRSGSDYVLDTGSPHYISIKEDISDMDIIPEAHAIRYNDVYEQEGINVNFVKFGLDHIDMRTYERGVEDETLSCGTGVTAASIVYIDQVSQAQGAHRVSVKTQGGNLEVRAEKENGVYKEIWLCGPAVKSYEGIIEL